MPRNLFVSYDLHTPGQRYDRVIAKIKELGGVWAKVHYSLFYVRSEFTAEQAARHILPALDANDSLMVIDTNNNDAHWYNIDPENSEYLQRNWVR